MIVGVILVWSELGVVSHFIVVDVDHLRFWEGDGAQQVILCACYQLFRFMSFRLNKSFSFVNGGHFFLL